VSLFDWIRAWEAAMAESGYPRARITPEYYGPEDGWGYGWVDDVDAFAGEAMGIESPAVDHQAAWQTAHIAFILVDGLRPEWMTPSPMLAQLLTEL
jgi:hypothetical protein